MSGRGVDFRFSALSSTLHKSWEEELIPQSCCLSHVLCFVQYTIERLTEKKLNLNQFQKPLYCMNVFRIRTANRSSHPEWRGEVPSWLTWFSHTLASSASCQECRPSTSCSSRAPQPSLCPGNPLLPNPASFYPRSSSLHIIPRSIQLCKKHSTVL